MLDTGYYFNRSTNFSTSSSVVAQEVTKPIVVLFRQGIIGL
jgi:hypothetical protein